MVQFEDFQIPQPILRALADMGFTQPSPIQASAIPVALSGGDLIGQAQTGTGKTAAFGIPLVAAALDGRPSLVLVPTRELAQQVCGEVDRIGQHAGVRALALFGGAAFGPQARALAAGDRMILVATPGRLRDHLERGTLDASGARLVVLDEADEMLKMGFVEEVEAILDAVGPERQTLLFSATMPEPVVRLAERYMRDPEMVVAEAPNDSVANANTEQFAVAVEHREKTDVLVRILAVERPTGTLVFRHTRESVDDLVRDLRARGVEAEALHGGMAQERREDVLRRLRDGRSLVLVATNVAARGLDVDRISHVVNFDAPRETEAYVHRIGRTGRAGREGKSLLFVTPADRGRLRGIERAVGERLAWYEVPTDAQVHDAVGRHALAWLAERTDEPEARHLAVVDRLVADGADPRALAARLLGLLAPHEGLDAPPLEARRERAPRRAATDVARPRGERGAMAALVLNAGRDDGVRPADVVGMLANEGGLTGQDVGRIDILPRMTVAEVPREALHHLLDALEGATLRKRRAAPRVAERWEFRAPALTARRAP